uniref:hypothetical protein n=1 Tax=Flavobacterium sp. UGB4466 TaxID=2730889 RepID=UPI001ED97D20
MLSFNKKVRHLESYLLQAHENYADSFKEDIVMFIDDFSDQNELLSFLNNIDSFEEIENWVDKLCSRIVLKFDSEGEEINDFIYD